MTGVFHTGAVFDFQEPSRRVVPEGSPAPAVAVIPPPHSVRVWNRWQRRIRGSGNSAGCLPGERRFRTSFVVRFQSFAVKAWGDRPTVRRPRKRRTFRTRPVGPTLNCPALSQESYPFGRESNKIRGV